MFYRICIRGSVAVVEHLKLVTIKLDLAMSDHLNGVILLMSLSSRRLTPGHHMKQRVGRLNYSVTGHNLM